MDALTSTEFRKRYAALIDVTLVTVNGHIIGAWYPRESWAEPGIGDSWDRKMLGAVPEEAERRIDPAVARFNSRPFTPVPKAGSRKA